MGKLRGAIWLAALLGLATAGVSAPALAQSLPEGAITIVQPNPPGGPLDLMARLLAPKLEASLKRQVLIEYKPGAGTYIGGEYVARSAPDGRTLLINAYSGVNQHLFVKGLSAKLAEELVPVAPLSDTPFLAYGPTAMEPKNLKEFVAYVKANPKKLNAAIYPNTASALEMIQFIKANNMDILTVPYSSTAAIVNAMLGGDVHIYNGGISGAKPQMDQGKLRGLAVLSEKRDPAIPEVPTARELGLDWVSSVYYVMFAPAKTPPAILRALNEAIIAAQQDPDLRDRMEKAGAPIAPPATPEQMAARLKTYYEALVKTAKEANIEPQ